MQIYGFDPENDDEKEKTSNFHTIFYKFNTRLNQMFFEYSIAKSDISSAIGRSNRRHPKYD